MIEYAHAEHRSRLDKLAGDLDILPARRRISARVVVRQDDGTSAGKQSCAKDLTGPHDRRRPAAAAVADHTNDSVSCVYVDGPERLRALVVIGVDQFTNEASNVEPLSQNALNDISNSLEGWADPSLPTFMRQSSPLELQ